jgi:hypothetical protein
MLYEGADARGLVFDVVSAQLITGTLNGSLNAKALAPFKLRPVLKGPELNMDGDDEGNTWPDGVGWALSWGCQLTFGRDEETGEPTVCVSMSDEDLRRGITSRTAKRHQVAEFARLLAAQFGEPSTVVPDPRDAEIERLREELARVAHPDAMDELSRDALRRQRDDARQELDHLRASNYADEQLRFDAYAELLNVLDEGRHPPVGTGTFPAVRAAIVQALDLRAQYKAERDEAREEWKRADAEVTRLKRLVGDENVPYDGWDGQTRQDAIVRVEEAWQEHLKQRDQIEALTAERDRLRQELNTTAWEATTAEANGHFMANALDDVREILKRVEGELIKPSTSPEKPAEPRRWRAGDPEPEIGTTVLRRGDRYVRGRDGWRRADLHTGYGTWDLMTDGICELVEVVGTDG